MKNLAMNSRGLHIIVNDSGMFWAGHTSLWVPFQSSLFIILHTKYIILDMNSQHSCNEMKVLWFSEEPWLVSVFNMPLLDLN